MIFILSFLALIFIGFLLLNSPMTKFNGAPVAWGDALFTATSAACVTGLTVLPISGFNWFGQVVILILVEIGGVGVMSLSAFIILLLGRKFSYSGTLMLSHLNDNFSIRNLEELIRMTLFYTLTIQGAGFMLLLCGFTWNGNMSMGSALYYSAFHSITGFCNAGLSLFDESMVGQSAFVKMTMAMLIFAGGLGIYAIYDIAHYRRGKSLLVHTKLVLITTLILIGGAMLAIHFGQRLKPIGWVDSLFMAISGRTAGFNSVPMEVFNSGTRSVFVVLMMIGAAPGSTGGGIRVTAVALAVLAIINTIKGNERLVVFKREIPTQNVMRAFTMILLYISLTALGVMVISFVSLSSSEKTLFETVAALGTVGMSLGFSAEADSASRLLIILYMFIGRVGPFSIFLFLLGRDKRSYLKYPEERIIVG